MSYEQFRISLSSRLMDRNIPPEVLHDVLQELDIVATNYDIHRACTDIIVSGGLPEIVKNYCAALAVENKALGTIDGYRRELSKFFAFVQKPFNMVTKNDVRVYMFNRQQHDNLKKSTVEHIRVIINAFYSWVVDDELMDRNPARHIEPIRVPKSERQALPPIDLEYLRQACNTPREKALVDFLYSTGCRVSECAAVELSDINWVMRSVKIRHGKGDKQRTTYFNAEAEVSLKAYIESKPHPETKALFSKTRAPYTRLTSHALEDEIKRIRVRADQLTVDVTPHVLRHTFATTAISNGAPVQHVQQLMGHASLDTTMIYTHIAQDDVAASHRKFVN